MTVTVTTRRLRHNNDRSRAVTGAVTGLRFKLRPRQVTAPAVQIIKLRPPHGHVTGRTETRTATVTVQAHYSRTHDHCHGDVTAPAGNDASHWQ